MHLRCLVGSYESHLYGLDDEFNVVFATSVHVGKVTSIAMNKTMFASAGNDESIKVYRQNKLLFTADMDGHVNEIGFSDHYLICTAGRFLVMYKKDELVQELRHMEQVISFAVHPSKRFLLSISKSHLYLFNLITGKKMVRESLKKYFKPTLYPLNIKFDTSGDHFYLVSDRYILVFQTDDCKCIYIFSSTKSITTITVTDTCFIGLDSGVILNINIHTQSILQMNPFQSRIKGLSISHCNEDDQIIAINATGQLHHFSHQKSSKLSTSPLQSYIGDFTFQSYNTTIHLIKSIDLNCRVTCFSASQ